MDNWETTGLEDLNCHSSRRERHQMGGIDKNSGKMGFFQKNPSFKIYIIDLIFIAIISGVIVPFVYKNEGTTKIENYKIVLKVFEYDDKIMLTLTVSEKDNIDLKDLVEADFYLDMDSEHVTETDILPGSGEKRVLKTGLLFRNEKYAFCSITINGENKTIKKKIK